MSSVMEFLTDVVLAVWKAVPYLYWIAFCFIEQWHNMKLREQVKWLQVDLLREKLALKPSPVIVRSHTLSEKTVALIRLASNETTNQNEAKAAALKACKGIAQDLELNKTERRN